MFTEEGRYFVFMGVGITLRVKIEPCKEGIGRFVLNFEASSMLELDDAQKALKEFRRKLSDIFVRELFADRYEIVQIFRTGEIVVVPNGYVLTDNNKFAFQELVEGALRE